MARVGSRRVVENGVEHDLGAVVGIAGLEAHGNLCTVGETIAVGVGIVGVCVPSPAFGGVGDTVGVGIGEGLGDVEADAIVVVGDGGVGERGDAVGDCCEAEVSPDIGGAAESLAGGLLPLGGGVGDDGIFVVGPDDGDDR